MIWKNNIMVESDGYDPSSLDCKTKILPLNYDPI